MSISYSQEFITLWVKQATPVMIHGSVKDVKGCYAIRKASRYFGGRNRDFKASDHLTSQRIVRNVGLSLVNPFLAQGYALVRILNALKIKPIIYYNWHHW